MVRRRLIELRYIGLDDLALANVCCGVGQVRTSLGARMQIGRRLYAREQFEQSRMNLLQFARWLFYDSRFPITLQYRKDSIVVPLGNQFAERREFNIQQAG